MRFSFVSRRLGSWVHFYLVTDVIPAAQIAQRITSSLSTVDY